jgi:hypothetical protein
MSDGVKIAMITVLGTLFGTFMQYGSNWFGILKKAEVVGCNFKTISGEIYFPNSSENWNMEVDFARATFSAKSKDPAIEGSHEDTSIEYACKGDVVFFRRNGMATWYGGGKGEANCFHVGKVAGDTIDGDFACLGVPQGGKEKWRWKGILNK